ncbi:MAG: Ig-like domain-containing protein, partial [Elusimicrobia bacterium]|nr:Ig-like domain-containing protein [Elusimicrobiota bacterium]
LATALSAGAARVIASSGAITGYAALTVTLPALTVASIAPSSGAVGTSVPAALVGTGFDASAALTLERAEAAQGTWTVTGAFTQARFAGTLTKLRDGRALLAGGMLEGLPPGLTDVDLYDPATQTWSSGPPLRSGRNQYNSVLLPDGRVLAVGGRGPSGDANASAELYDPVSSTWTTAAPLSHGRWAFALALLPDGRVLAAGGWDGVAALNSAEIYDPAADAWTAAPAMGTERVWPAFTAVAGKVLVSGGSAGTGVATAEIYDPGTNSWSPAGTMNEPRYLHKLAVLPDGKVLAAGGLTADAAEVYDLATGTWTPTGPVGVRRYVQSLVLVAGVPMIIGGENTATDHASTELYDAAANVWRPGPALTATRTWPMAVVLDDGRVLTAGGRQGLGGGATLNTAEVLAMPTSQIPATGVAVSDAQNLSGTFDLAGAATGYWDVVVRESGGRTGRLDGGFRVTPGAPALASISVAPATASLPVGATVQFSAAGTFTDGSTRTLTSGEVAWTTDLSSVATVNAGLATGV